MCKNFIGKAIITTFTLLLCHNLPAAKFSNSDIDKMLNNLDLQLDKDINKERKSRTYSKKTGKKAVLNPELSPEANLGAMDAQNYEDDKAMASDLGGSLHKTKDNLITDSMVGAKVSTPSADATSTDTIAYKNIEASLRPAVIRQNLRSILEKAKASNGSIQALNYDVNQARREALIAKLKFIPRLDLGYNLNAATTPGNLHGAQNNFNVKAEWEFFSGFATINEIRSKTYMARSSSSSREYAISSLQMQIIEAYYGYFNAKANIQSLEQKQMQINSDISRKQKLYNEGLNTIDDLESLRAQGSLNEYNIADAKLVLEKMRLTLDYLVGVKIEGLTREVILEPKLIKHERSDILALRQEIKALKFQNKQLNYFPTISLFDKYDFNNVTSASPALKLANANTPKNQNIIGIAIKLPLFDDFGLTVQKQSMRMHEMSKQKSLDYKISEQNKDTAYYARALDIAKKKIASATASLKSANISFNSIKRKYNAQLVTFTDYLQALSTKYDAEATFNQSLNNYELQKAYYIFYSGQNILDYIK